MDMTSLIVNLISGAVGGNAAGAAIPDKSLGTLEFLGGCGGRWNCGSDPASHRASFARG